MVGTEFEEVTESLFVESLVEAGVPIGRDVRMRRARVGTQDEKMVNTLLVVDDDDIHRRIICRIAEKSGFEAVGAESFNKAADFLSQNKVDCITLDLTLGSRAGVEVLRLLSSLHCVAPIIVISGAEANIFDETMSIGKSLGLDLRSPVSKPVDLGALRISLVQICQQVDLRKLGCVSA
jgi:DNA-binding NtrC family response regulator